MVGSFQGIDAKTVCEAAGKPEGELNRSADELERFWLLVHDVPAVVVR